jgi:hypothetical protein
MDVKKKIEEVVEIIKSDDNFAKFFENNPTEA